MYIEGLKEKVLHAQKYLICSLDYRKEVFEIFKVIYPEIVKKYGESWVSKEDFLEALFLEVHTLDTKRWPILFYLEKNSLIEPIVLNDDMKEKCDFAYFKYQDESEWIDLNEWLDDLGWYEDEREVEVSKLDNNELTSAIKEWQEELEESQDIDDARIAFLLQCELKRRLAVR